MIIKALFKNGSRELFKTFYIIYIKAFKINSFSFSLKRESLYKNIVFIIITHRLKVMASKCHATHKINLSVVKTVPVQKVM